MENQKTPKQLAEELAAQHKPMNEIAGAIYEGGFGLTQAAAIRIAKEAVTIRVGNAETEQRAPAVQSAVTAAQLKEAIEAIRQIRTNLNFGRITFDEAKTLSEPHIKTINLRGAEIAKRFDQPYKPVGFNGLMR